jgi:uncharacterized membrane protein
MTTTVIIHRDRQPRSRPIRWRRWIVGITVAIVLAVVGIVTFNRVTAAPPPEPPPAHCKINSDPSTPQSISDVMRGMQCADLAAGR